MTKLRRLAILPTMDEFDALALEYQRIYGNAGRDIDITNFVNNPTASGKVRVFGLGFSEQPFNLVFTDRGALEEC